ncbi:hypothetical protein ABW22_11425 [Thiobacillus denitrificans]|uniref:Uncharacterized protein n=1 Tax=Thiobacillus denitrificans TaxID=36861 RepID=A0A119CVD0_THIDE|nr:hypothetical protein ABW22_11425 [Thiobacillus denitrificans]
MRNIPHMAQNNDDVRSNFTNFVYYPEVTAENKATDFVFAECELRFFCDNGFPQPDAPFIGLIRLAR